MRGGAQVVPRELGTGQLSTITQVSRPVGQYSYSVKDGTCQLVKSVPVGRRRLAESQEWIGAESLAGKTCESTSGRFESPTSGHPATATPGMASLLQHISRSDSRMNKNGACRGQR